MTLARRQFISALGGALFAWPLDALAQQSTPLVGFIHGRAADAFGNRVAAFRAGLGEEGYVESRNVVIDCHRLEGHYDLLPGVLADLIRRRVAVIATPGSTPASIAAKAATAMIPSVR